MRTSRPRIPLTSNAASPPPLDESVSMPLFPSADDWRTHGTPLRHRSCGEAHERLLRVAPATGAGLVASRSGDRQQTAFEQATPRLTRRVREEEASERLDEVLIVSPPRSWNASSFVAMKTAGVTTRTLCSAISKVRAVSIAAGYHRLLKPRTSASTGTTSRRHRQSGAPRVVSSASPSLRSRSESAVYFAYDVTSSNAFQARGRMNRTVSPQSPCRTSFRDPAPSVGWSEGRSRPYDSRSRIAKSRRGGKYRS